MSDFWQQTIATAETLRHELHSMPELGWHEVQTADKVRSTLSKLGIAWRSCAGTGTLATLNEAASKQRHIALRGDIDGLPITEQTNKAYSSRHDGCMHACGHDGHTATLLATAQWLKRHEQKLDGAVTLLFQPAEEGGHGALRMIENGALEGIDEIYGWHNWPAIPFGEMLCPDGIVMSGNGTFSIEITGVGGHASQPELCRDPVLAAGALTVALQQIVSRRLPPQSAAVVAVTSIDARSSATVIPEKAVVSGSIRVPNQEVREWVNAAITQISHDNARTYGVGCSVDLQPRYNATINHAHQAGSMRALWQQEWGEAAVNKTLPTPIMASEDFSYYLQEIPGAFALIGADDGPDHQAPCHSSHYDFNDALIPRVTRLFSRLAGAPVPPTRAESP